MTKQKHTHEKHKSNTHPKPKKTQSLVLWQTLTVIFALIAAVGFYKGFIAVQKPSMSYAQPGSCSLESTKKALDFINDKLVKPGTVATIKESYGSDDLCWIVTEYQGQEIPVVIKDKNYLMLPANVIDIQKEEQKEQEEKKKLENIPKAKRPQIDLMIMSFCPYGRAAAQNMEKLYEKFGDDADIRVHYIVYPKSFYEARGANTSKFCVGNYCSMHGVKEVEEDMREVCIAKEYGWEKYWEYMKQQLSQCNMDNIDTCWKQSAEKVGIDTQKIESCVKNKGEQYMEEEYQFAQKYNLPGSPTLVVNTNFTQTGLVPIDKYQEIICNSFEKPPASCGEVVKAENSVPSGTCG